MASKSAKLETAQELFDLFSDEQKLKAYQYTQPVENLPEGFSNETVYFDLPFEEIREIVLQKKEEFFSKIPDDEKDTLVWEHVGSTAIKGMPGTKFPDALLILPEFPPSKNVIQAFLDCGYYFSQSSHLDTRDLWFFYVFTDGILKHHKLTVHVTLEDNKAGKILRATRDMCNNEEWAFEDYKKAKIEGAKKAETGGFMDYKKTKGTNSKLLQMLREKYA